METGEKETKNGIKVRIYVWRDGWTDEGGVEGERLLSELLMLPRTEFDSAVSLVCGRLKSCQNSITL